MTEASSRSAVSGRAVVFDLDGTLVDSSPDLATAVNVVRSRIGLAPAPLERVTSWIGEGARVLVELATAELAGGPPLDERLADFLAAYDRVCLDATRPYPGVDALVRDLARRGAVALLTNKPERMSRRLLAHFGWTSLFDPVIGGDTLPFRKPDPRGLVAIAERLGRGADDLVLVGDSAIDAATARAAGSRFVWVEWGFAGAAERRALAAGDRAASAEELAERLSGAPR